MKRTKEMTHEDVVLEFIEDIKLAFGTGKGDNIDSAAMCWPDLAITYRNALAVCNRKES